MEKHVEKTMVDLAIENLELRMRNNALSDQLAEAQRHIDVLTAPKEVTEDVED